MCFDTLQVLYVIVNKVFLAVLIKFDFFFFNYFFIYLFFKCRVHCKSSKPEESY